MHFASRWVRLARSSLSRVLFEHPTKNLQIVLAIVFVVQGVAVLLFGAAYNLSIGVLFLTQDTLETKLTHHTVLAPAIHQIFMLNIAWVVAAFLFIGGIMYGLAATKLKPVYEQQIKKGVNVLRWTEHSLTAACMMALVGLVVGVTDLATLVLLMGFGLALGFGGAYAEHRPSVVKQLGIYSLLRRVVVGAVVLVPWLVIIGYVGAADVFGTQRVPGYVYWIVPSIFLFFAAYAWNVYASRRKQGKWTSYGYAERWYMIISLIMKSVVAWEIFIAMLRP